MGGRQTAPWGVGQLGARGHFGGAPNPISAQSALGGPHTNPPCKGSAHTNPPVNPPPRGRPRPPPRRRARPRQGRRATRGHPRPGPRPPPRHRPDRWAPGEPPRVPARARTAPPHPRQGRPADRRAGPACPGPARRPIEPSQLNVWAFAPSAHSTYKLTYHTHTYAPRPRSHTRTCEQAPRRLSSSSPSAVFLAESLGRVDGRVLGCRHHRDLVCRHVCDPRVSRGEHGAAARRRGRGPRVLGRR